MALKPFLFAADLDGTLLPNTSKKPASGCLERTRALLQFLMHNECPVCYISGRHLELARDGRKVFNLPVPTYWVCNVGSEIYDQFGQSHQAWKALLGTSFDHAEMWQAVAGLDGGLALQESGKQGPHKFSLYYPGPAPPELQSALVQRLSCMRRDLRLIHSVEEATGKGLLDILPNNAGKAASLSFLAKAYHKPPMRTFFAGDSGNDLDALTSGVCGTVVGNAPSEVRSQARNMQANTSGSRLYIATGFYGDGIIEGLRKFRLLPPSVAF